MAHIPWENIMYGEQHNAKPYRGANVKFFYAYQENRLKSEQAGRPIFDEIPSISIQYPGMDETVRKVEPRDIEAYPEAYQAFKNGSEPVEHGTPLSEWSLLPGSAMRELQYLGFKTVEQLPHANDDVKRRMGPLVQFIKKAQDWLDAANAPQNEMVLLKESLEREKARAKRMEEQLAILMQRIDATEGNNLYTKTVVADSALDSEQIEEQPRRGRPRKAAE